MVYGEPVSWWLGQFPYTVVFVLQTNENMEVTSALQSEQHVKKELAKKLGQLQENLAELKETVSTRSGMAGLDCANCWQLPRH